jgi:arylsulfatase A
MISSLESSSLMNSMRYLSFLLGALLGFGLSNHGHANTHPHIVVILVDDMGYGDAGCYNAKSKIPTPHIDRLAANGMRFTDAHAAGPLCHPSRYGLLTGRFPFRIDTAKWPTQPLIEKGQMTIASLLRDAGYATSMVGKWHLGFAENGYEKPLPGGPADRGFQQFFGIRASTDIPPYFYIRGNRAVQAPTGHIAANLSDGWSPIQGAFWREGGISPDLKLIEVVPRFTDEAIKVIQQRDTQKPLMLYLAYPGPHTPWLPTPEFEGKSGAGMYGDFMMMIDHEIGRVLGVLDAADMSRETLLLFASDNGPVWYPDDIKRFSHDSAGGLRGMKGDAWEAGHRVPFIVRWPGKIAAGSTSTQTLCFTDLLATLAEITGTQLPDGAALDSVSFLPALRGETHTRPPIVMESGNGLMMIRSGPWKLIAGLGSGGFSKPSSLKPGPGDPAGQLYHLLDDPAETTNRFGEQPEIVERLQTEIRDSIAVGGAAGK